MTRPARTWLVAAGTAAIVAAANGSEGAYFSQSWGWVALAFLVPATVALILGVTHVPGRLRIAFALLLGILAVWIAVSTTWSVSPSGSVREVERVLVYVAVALAITSLLRAGDARAVAGGALAGIVGVVGYGLATRLFPDRLETYDDPELPFRLAEPIGYWNAFGLLASMGILLGLGAAAHARRIPLRIAAAAAVPVLGTGLYFSYSRGAWLALGAGYVAAVAVDPRRLRLLWTTLALAPAIVFAITSASRKDALTNEGASVARAVAQGEELAEALVVAACAAAVLALAAALVARRVVPPRRARRAFDVALAIGAAGAVVAVLAAGGGPRATFEALKERFDAELVVSRPGALNERLFSLSGNGRSDHLSVTWEMASARPLLGHGAGTFEYFWYERRNVRVDVRDAHSLYAETLAEIGVVGLVLLVSAVAVVLAAIVRGRRHRLTPVAGGAYVAWAAHSAVDWNWEVVGVTATALLLGAVGLLASERGTRPTLRGPVRPALMAFATALSIAATVSLVGNQALFAARDAVRRGEFARAVADARRAQQLLPWSHEPVVVLGDAAAGLGDRASTVRAYREAVDINPRSWPAWLRLAQVAAGNERTRAYARVRELNPLEDRLPGEDRTSGGPPSR